jgi:hypothetical protein
LSNARATISSTGGQAGKFRERRFSEIFLCFDPAQQLTRDCGSSSNPSNPRAFVLFTDHSASLPDARNRADPAQGN